MFRNYCKIAFRNLIKSKFTSSINIGGLAISLAGFIIILLYVNHELSYDRWDPTLQSVYRISSQEEGSYDNKNVPVLTAQLLQEHVADIAVYTHVQPSGNYEVLIGAGDNKVYQKDVVMADSSFLQVFPYKLLAGNRTTAFNQPNSALITPELGRKLFGNTDPIGKMVMVYNKVPFTVTGVLEVPDIPSHLHTALILRDPFMGQVTGWGNISYTTYVRLRKPAAVSALESKINTAFYDHHLKTGSQSYEAYLKSGHHPSLMAEPVADIHNFPRFGKSPFKTTMILLSLAGLLLLSGALNSGNLMLVKTLRRAREVGVRKIMGSARHQVVTQFLLEVAFQCLLSLALALLLCLALLPAFNRMFDLSLSLFRLFSYNMLLQCGAALLAIILISGLYPALMFARQQAAAMLKGAFKPGAGGKRFSHSLIVLQFTVSVFFIVSVLVMAHQMDFMKHRDIGFNPQQVIQVEAGQRTREENFEGTRVKLLDIPGVELVSKTTSVPGSVMDTSHVGFHYEGNSLSLTSVRVSTDFFRTLSIPVLKGRTFMDSHPEDLDNTAIINETAAKRLGIKDPVGSLIRFAACDSVPYQIVGVVKDFQVVGFDSYIAPTLYSISNAHCTYMSGGSLLLKVRTANLEKTIAAIGRLWETVEPGIPLRYSFLDDNFQRLFNDYNRLQHIVHVFTLVSILISIMGLLALTVYMTEQRVKEIGIRKVLGASVSSIVGLLSKDFLILVIISISIASPIAWYLLEYWLRDFAYRTDVSWYLFAMAGAGTLLIAFATVGLQSLKAAGANPVASLKMD